MSVIHAPKKPELEVRMLLFPGAMLLLLSVLFAKLWYIQVVRAPELIESADRTKTIEVTSPAPRGLIFDRNGVLIAGVKPQVVITAVPAVLAKHPEVLGQVAAILGVPAAKLEHKLKQGVWRPYLPTPIFVGATIQQGIKIAEDKDGLPGIDVPTPLPPMRYYPDGLSYSHMLGYVWTPSKGDVERIEKLKLKPADYVGKTGLERAFEGKLMGEPGSEKMQIDSHRRPIRIAARDIANPGQELYLSIDSDLQKFATEYLAHPPDPKGGIGKPMVGGVVAIDPRNGEILCLVSSPTFDQNLFSRGISETDYKSLLDNPNKPLIDRAIYSSYAPGSTFKIVTTLAAYETGKFDPGLTFECDGGVRLGRAFFKCLSHHGRIGFYEAVAKSCNSYFYQLGRYVGKDALQKASLEVGLGQREGIEIGGETKGTVPTDAYIKRMRTNGNWSMGDTFNYAIGQGFLTATPIQLANMVALVANNGTSYKPHLVRAIKSADGRGKPEIVQPEVLHHVDASTDFWNDLHRALTGVLEPGGTAYYFAHIPGFAWAGKTGSAEHGPDKNSKPNALFVGYAPAENPTIAICVVVESEGHGGEYAAPIAKDMVLHYLKSTDPAALPKTTESPSAVVASSASPTAR